MKNKNNLPRFTAGLALSANSKNVSFTSDNLQKADSVIMQKMRLPGGLGGLIPTPVLYGFWSCALCWAGCGILSGGDFPACALLCSLECQD